MYELFERAVNALESIAQSLNDSSFTNWGIFIASMGTVGVGIGSLLLSKRHIRLSEERQNDEQFERMRPWITITEPAPLQVIFQDNQTMEWTRYLQLQSSTSIMPSKVRIGSRFTNTGTRPAGKLKKISFGQDAPITRAAVERYDEDELDMDMGPNQSHYQFYDIPWGSYDNSNERPIYFAFRVSYNNGKYRSYSGIIYKLSRSISEAITVWYT